MVVEGKKGGELYRAQRLIRTETNFILNQATKDMYEEAEVEEYEFLGTLDSRTCEHCGGLDGKHYPVKDEKPGVNYPPLHPFCRCTTIPYFADLGGERAARAAEGSSYTIPADISYSEWKAGLSPDEKSKMAFNQKTAKNWAADKEQFAKYKAIFKGKDFPKSFADFQDLKYNRSEVWTEFVRQKQSVLNSLDYSERLDSLFGKVEVRSWYRGHIAQIPQLLDKAEALKEQAEKAFSLRNKYRTQARNMMKDRDKVKDLDKKHPNPSFEEILEHKRRKYHLDGDDLYVDIIRSASTSNKEIDRDLGF